MIYKAEEQGRKDLEMWEKIERIFWLSLLALFIACLLFPDQIFSKVIGG